MLIDSDDAKIQNIFFNVKSYMNYDTEMTFMNAVISQKELDFLYETTLDGLSNNLVKTMLKYGLFYEKQIC